MTHVNALFTKFRNELGVRNITQGTWHIDSVNGRDNRSGVTFGNAIQSLPEFVRRVNYGTFRQPTAVHLYGDFSTETMRLVVDLAPGATLLVSGQNGLTITDTFAVDAITADNPAGNEATLVEVTGRNWTADINRRARVTTGAATGSVAWIAKDAPNGASADVVRTSAFGDMAPFTLTVQKADPSAADTVVMEDLVKVGSVDLFIISSVGTISRIVQFEDLEYVGEMFAVSGHVNANVVRCNFNGARAYGTGIMSLLLCHYKGGAIGSTGMDLVLSACLVSTTTGITVLSMLLVIFVDVVVQDGIVVTRTSDTRITGLSVFDGVRGLEVSGGSYCIILGNYYGSNMSDVGAQVNRAASLVFNTTPTMTGTLGACRIGADNAGGGTVFATYAAGVAGSPVSGAGLFT